MEKPIVLVTTLDPEIISGGNIYNRSLCQAVAATGRSMSIEFTNDIETYISQNYTTKTLIIDSVAITKGANWNRFDELCFLIHMWPSDQASTEEQVKLEKHIANRYTLIHAGRQSANKYIRSKDAFILNPGIDSIWKRNQSTVSFPTKLITIANINGNKGYLDTAKALIRNVTLSWSWDIYGNTVDQDTYNSLCSLVSKHGLEDRILIKGPCAPADVNQIMCSAHLLLHLSKHENNSMVIRESIAAGLPFISTPTGDYDYLSKLGCGVFTEGFSVEDISNALVEMLTDQILYQQQLETVQRTEIPTWTQVASKFIKYINN